MQELVQLAQTCFDVSGLIVHVTDVIFDAIAYGQKIVLLAVQIQCFAHLLVNIGQVCISGLIACHLKRKALHTVQGGLLLYHLRPCLYAFAVDTDALRFASVHAIKNRLRHGRIAAANLRCVQRSLCVPETRHRCKGGLQFFLEVFNFQIGENFGGILGIEEQCSQQYGLNVVHHNLGNSFCAILADCGCCLSGNTPRHAFITD